MLLRGRAVRSSRRTETPPTPESNTPMFTSSVVLLGEIEHDTLTRQICELRRQAALGEAAEHGRLDGDLVREVLPARAVLLRVVLVGESEAEGDAIALLFGGVQRIQSVFATRFAGRFQPVRLEDIGIPAGDDCQGGIGVDDVGRVAAPKIDRTSLDDIAEESGLAENTRLNPFQ